MKPRPLAAKGVSTSGRNRNARLALLPRRRWLDPDTRRRLRAGFTSLRDIADLIVEGEA